MIFSISLNQYSQIPYHIMVQQNNVLTLNKHSYCLSHGVVKISEPVQIPFTIRYKGSLIFSVKGDFVDAKGGGRGRWVEKLQEQGFWVVFISY